MADSTELTDDGQSIPRITQEKHNVFRAGVDDVKLAGKAIVEVHGRTGRARFLGEA